GERAGQSDSHWQGTQTLAEKAREDLVSVFILPPPTRELERRLKARAQDSAAEVTRRMAKAADEMSHWAEYDYIIVNHDIESSTRRVQAILQAERLRRERQVGLSEVVSRCARGNRGASRRTSTDSAHGPARRTDRRSAPPPVLFRERRRGRGGREDRP